MNKILPRKSNSIERTNTLMGLKASAGKWQIRTGK